jgi:FKBP-type peptidyl-prolyl cis-trans isomerase FkpA
VHQFPHTTTKIRSLAGRLIAGFRDTKSRSNTVLNPASHGLRLARVRTPPALLARVCYLRRVTLRFLAMMIAIVAAAVCGRDSEEERQQTPMADSGITALQKNDTTPGTGSEARRGMAVRVHYTGWLYDPVPAGRKGTKFDSSRDRGEPFEFRLGAGEVIPGWDEGVAGMKVGGTRVLTIPPNLAYGSGGAAGVIPPNATLVFEIELLDVR